MNKGPHVIKLTPGGVPPVIHISQYEGGDGSTVKFAYDQDLDFILLTSESQYYAFHPGKNNQYGGDLQKPALFHFTRPDGYEETLSMSMSRGNRVVGHTDQSGTTYYFTEPHIVSLRNLPFQVTEIPGDVVCEIEILLDSNEKQSVQRSENFILRVEPYPVAVTSATYGTIGTNGAQDSGSGTGGNSSTGTYYASDTVDMSLVSWEEVVSGSNDGTLKELIEAGQEIRAVMLSTGQYMGIRCIHVEDGYTAWFESKNLFRAPDKYNPAIGEVYGYAAAEGWSINCVMLPSEIKNVSTRISAPTAYNVFGTSANQPYQYVDDYYGDGDMLHFDYYKSADGRRKTLGNGVQKEWITCQNDARIAGSKIVTENKYLVAINGDLTKAPYHKIPEDGVYLPLVWKLQSENKPADSGGGEYDTLAWKEVKSAANEGILKQLLTVGQLMPELPTLGVLRCVHIEDHWAAFEETVLTRMIVDYSLVGAFDETRLPLTEDEKDIFTQLSTSSSAYGNTYGQTESGYNNGYASSTSYFNIGYPVPNTTLRNTRFDYYADNDATKRVKRNSVGTAVSYWGATSGSGSGYSAYYFNTNGGLGNTMLGNSGRATYYVNGVFVVGEIS